MASAVTAWASTITQPTSSNLALLDAAVGLAFVAASATSGGPLAQRGWVVAVGVAWPLGVLPAARSLHSALLLMALTAYPSGRIRRPWQILVALIAILMGLQLFNQLATAAAFAFCAFGSALAWRRRRVSTPYAAISATAISGVLSTAWFLERYSPGQFRPSEVLLAYEGVLVLIAVGYAIVVRADRRRRAALEDRLVADAGPAGLHGLESVLREVLRDPQLQILRPEARPMGTRARILTVLDGLSPIAHVRHNANPLDDPATAEAVATAVRLTLTQEHRRGELAQRVAALEAARVRIVASADRQREQAAEALRNELRTLGSVRADLHRVRATASSEAALLFDVIDGELNATTREVSDLVAGVPPTELGGGRLHAALQDLAVRCPILVSLAIPFGTNAGADEETALYYVCLEVLTNAMKHSSASHVNISLTRNGTALVMTVSDDGVGGADPAGSGLQGLSDRLATLGGRLQVHSAPGAGTSVTAIIPVIGSSARA